MNFSSFVKKRYTLPKRPYKNLEDYRNSFRTFIYKNPDNNNWPCVYCEGSGSYRDIKDLDPVEGYKLAPRYKCNCCNGSGNGSKEEIKKRYDLIIKKWQTEKLDIKNKRNKALKLVSNFKQDDIIILRDIFSTRGSLYV